MKRRDRVGLTREVRRLRTPLTIPERIVKSEDLSKGISLFDETVLHHKTQKSRMREIEKAQELSIRELATDVKLGSEVREVACRWVADFPRRVVELQRLDNNRIVESRPMTDQDRQLAIDAAVDEADEIPLADLVPDPKTEPSTELPAEPGDDDSEE